MLKVDNMPLNNNDFRRKTIIILTISIIKMNTIIIYHQIFSIKR